jgi:hypothetical protein
MIMQTFNNLTEAQRDHLTKLAGAHGTTPERLIAAALRRDTREREAARTDVPHPIEARKHPHIGFHIGESAIGIRRR